MNKSVQFANISNVNDLSTLKLNHFVEGSDKEKTEAIKFLQSRLDGFSKHQVDAFWMIPNVATTAYRGLQISIEDLNHYADVIEALINSSVTKLDKQEE